MMKLWQSVLTQKQLVGTYHLPKIICSQNNNRKFFIISFILLNSQVIWDAKTINSIYPMQWCLITHIVKIIQKTEQFSKHRTPCGHERRCYLKTCYWLLLVYSPNYRHHKCVGRLFNLSSKSPPLEIRQFYFLSSEQ